MSQVWVSGGLGTQGHKRGIYINPSSGYRGPTSSCGVFSVLRSTQLGRLQMSLAGDHSVLPHFLSAVRFLPQRVRRSFLSLARLPRDEHTIVPLACLRDRVTLYSGTMGFSPSSPLSRIRPSPYIPRKVRYMVVQGLWSMVFVRWVQEDAAVVWMYLGIIVELE